MSVLVDTGVLYADHDTDASRHEQAASALGAVYDADLGQPYVSDYIYDEAVTLRQPTRFFECRRQCSRTQLRSPNDTTIKN